MLDPSYRQRETAMPAPARRLPSLERKQTMRAVQITGPRRLEIREVIRPEPGAHQVRIRLEGSGVCGSNLPVWQGRSWIKYPLEPGAPGHEGWGTVEALGPNVAGVMRGDRVAVLSYHAFADYDIADAASVVRVPPAAPVFPGEALGCAVNVFRRSAIENGQNVAIIGIGFLGALLVQMAAAAGARVIALSRRGFAREIAERCGAAVALPLGDKAAALRLVAELTGGRGCERVIEAAGEQETLDVASDLTAVRGRLVIAGYHQDSPRTVNLQLWNWRGIDVINAHEREPGQYVDGMTAGAAMVAAGALDPAPLYTHGFDLEHAADAFTALEQRPERFLKAWIQTNA
jgi:threonine dehydrogenase-like Zn-dependent dehydrogenase